MYTTPTVDDFKAYFVRDFVYGTDINTNVLDQDISNALNESSAFVNVDFFATQLAFNVGFLNLGAHFMVMSLRAATQGTSGQFPWLQASKGVGNVNESYNIPQRILDNPELAMLSKTNYGAKYLFLILPQLSGQIFTVCGGTRP